MSPLKNEVVPKTNTCIKLKRPSLIATFLPVVSGALTLALIFAALPLLALPSSLNPIEWEYPTDFENSSTLDQYRDLLIDQFATHFKSAVSTEVPARPESAWWRLGVVVIGGSAWVLGVAALAVGGHYTKENLKKRNKRRSS